jgi:hypothetical protein
MFAAWLFGYLLTFSAIGNFVLNQHPPKFAIYLICVFFFIGLFAAIGIGMVHERSRYAQVPFFVAGLKEGMALFKSWLAYLLCLAAIAGVIALLS